MSSYTTDSSEKLAISLPRSLMIRIEKIRKGSGESRSSFIQRAILAFLESYSRKKKVDQYVTGYSKKPETKEEVKAAESAAAYLFSEEPWE